ncbi:MAG: hemolysin III family protein [Actinomycetota bacterium]
MPRLRGRLHQGAVIPTSLTGVTTMWLVDGLAARTAVGVFTVSIVAMLTASAVYHCHRDTPEGRLAARRVDHGTILVAIAGTQTAFWTLVGPAPVVPWIVAGIWTVAGAGFVHKVRHLSTTDSTGNWLFGTLGWSGAALVPWLFLAGWPVLVLVVTGGGAYSIGGVLLFRRIGNLWPGVVGYHEVWHALTILGFCCHGAAIVVLTTA